MVVRGQTVENPVTKERVVFHRTASDTAGEVSEFEAFIGPGWHLPSGHVHPRQRERFEITKGTLTMKVEGRTFEAGAGDVVVVEPGQSHNFWNRTDGEVSFKVEVRPALKIESLLETMYGLAADGKVNRWGIPNPLRLAVIANEHFDTVQLSFPPAWTQRAALALGAPVGRLLGFRGGYTRKPVSAPVFTTAKPRIAAPAAGRLMPALA
jgi:mannose-6-phosphate isomerase-like protein (cupin superfamily)